MKDKLNQKPSKMQQLADYDMTIINEGLDYHDLKGQIKPVVSVDEYAAKMGDDSDIVTLAFTLNSKLAGQDLVSWLELGYDFVLDADVSDGEISPGKYLVFVEMKRRTNVPYKIVELIKDMETLTDLPVSEWTVIVDENEHDANADILKQVITLFPKDYKDKKEKEEELNEVREIAGLETKQLYKDDTYTKNLKAMAGL